MMQTGETVVDIAIDRELNAIAVTSDKIIYIFDYQDRYSLIT